jgi:2'-5' RNA ligase
MEEDQSWALWLVPEGELYRRLAETIARLAEAYRAPRFEPHVTLAGVLSGQEAEMRGRCVHLAGVAHPCRIELSSPDFTEAYFQCLFIRVLPTAELMEAHRLARQIFGGTDEAMYEPHISLMYGHFPEETKRDIIDGLRDETEGKFTAEAFHLYNTSGDPHSWQRVEIFPVI